MTEPTAYEAVTAELDEIVAEIEREMSAFRALHREFPTWVAGDLKDAIGSVSPTMSVEARKAQVRYQELMVEKGCGG